MRVLIVKMSSMGDVLHTLPALTDAMKAHLEISFDWVVEPDFSEIPHWHPAVSRVFSVPLRKFKKKPWRLLWDKSLWQVVKAIRIEAYDIVIDAQGLMKSGVLTALAKGKKIGFSKASLREPLASIFYQQRFEVSRELHAIQRTRQLFAKALGYNLDAMPLEYGLSSLTFSTLKKRAYVAFLHGTSWQSKEWPDQYWLALAKQLAEKNIQVQLTWGTALQRQRAIWLSRQVGNIEVLPQLTIQKAAEMIYGARAVVAVDTGFAHLAAALEKPIVALFGATDAKKTGILGNQAVVLQSTISCSPCLKRNCPMPKKIIYPPCYQSLTPENVLQYLESMACLDD